MRKTKAYMGARDRVLTVLKEAMREKGYTKLPKAHPDRLYAALIRSYRLLYKVDVPTGKKMESFCTVASTLLGVNADELLLTIRQEHDARKLSRPESGKRPSGNRPKKARKLCGRKGVYQTEDWKRLRYQAIKKQGARCQACGASPKDDGIRLNVDHIKPISKRPDLAFDINNLQVLCSSCNWGKGAGDETDWR